MFKRLASMFTLFCLFLAPLPALAQDHNINEIKLVEQTVTNFFNSLNEKNGNLFLQTVIDAESEANQDYASNLQDISIDFRIIKTEKINDSKFEVSVLKNQNGIQFPIIPYEIVLEDGKWRFDDTSITIYPKKTIRELSVLKSISKHAVSENENYIVTKTENNTRSWGRLEYYYGETSVDIYSNGRLFVESKPGYNDKPVDQYNWVQADLLRKMNGELVVVDSRALSAWGDNAFYFYCEGYHRVKVANFNYPGLPGRFYVTYYPPGS